MAVSIVVIDDHPAIVAGVAAWCASARPSIDVLAVGAEPSAAHFGPGATADVVVFDLQLGAGGLAFDELETLVDAGRRVVVYSQHASGDTALRCLEVGASTYLTKAEGVDHLIPAIRAVAADRPYAGPVLSGAMATDRRQDRPHLSEREREVLLAWFASDSKQLVGERLFLSSRTVDTYIGRVRVKYANLGRPAPSKAALVARALQDGLVDLADL